MKEMNTPFSGLLQLSPPERDYLVQAGVLERIGSTV